MADVLNRTTLQYLQSVNTPDYPVVDWVINPDLSGVAGVPQKYWKLTGDVVSEMSQAEKDAVDAAVQPSVRWHASSVLTDAEKSVTETSPSWQELGGSVTTPSFFTPNVSSCKGRVVGQVKTNGTGAKLRLKEGSTTPSGGYDVPDTSGEWTNMQWFSPDAPTTGTHLYALEGQLPVSGATSMSVKYVAVSLLEFS